VALSGVKATAVLVGKHFGEAGLDCKIFAGRHRLQSKKAKNVGNDKAFQPRALAGYTTTMEQITHRYLDKWEKLSTLTWYPELRNYTLDIACKLIVGTGAIRW
jgi:hypothetical protein